MSWAFLIGGIVLLLFGGDWLVRGAVDLALRMKISILVVGMTVVSFATSAPELLVSLDAALDGHVDLSFGNVIGSNIANIALILGLTALVFPMKVQPRTYKVDYWIMLIVTGLLFFFLLPDKKLVFYEAALLVGFLVFYNIFQIRSSRKKQKPELKQAAKDLVEDEIIAAQPTYNKFWMVFYFVIGVAALKFGSEFLVKGAVELASRWGVSERVIGVTIVSIGTSLPELAASMVASFKGEQELSLGNLVGSNIFNILAVLGITGLVMPLPVESPSLLNFDFPYLIGVSLLIYPLMVWFGKGTISRWQGGLMFAIYVGYILWVI